MKGGSFKSPINGALMAPAVSHPGVNAWARENLRITLGHHLEIESIDIALVENERRAQTHFIIRHFNLAQTARAQFLIAALQLTGAQSVRGINSQVAQVESVPQHHALDDARVN